MNPFEPKAGDVLLCNRVESHKGTLSTEAKELVVIFLGTMDEKAVPDVPERLNKLGWSRSVVYEVSAVFSDGEQRWIHRMNFMAKSPKEAGTAAIRFSRRMLEEEMATADGVILQGISVNTMRLGEINEDGEPHNGRGPAMLRWGCDSGETLEELEARIQ